MQENDEPNQTIEKKNPVESKLKGVRWQSGTRALFCVLLHACVAWVVWHLVFIRKSGQPFSPLLWLERAEAIEPAKLEPALLSTFPLDAIICNWRVLWLGGEVLQFCTLARPQLKQPNLLNKLTVPVWCEHGPGLALEAGL